MVIITTNPFQGLKLEILKHICWDEPVIITTNPFQGLKQLRATDTTPMERVIITTNPFQGLKLTVFEELEITEALL